MVLTWFAKVIGLSSATSSDTELPFSTIGGMSSVTLPLRSGAWPMVLRIWACIVAGVARASDDRSNDTNPPAALVAPAALAAPVRKVRRVGSGLRSGKSSIGKSSIGKSSIGIFVLLIAQRHEIGHDILDLHGAQNGLAGKCRGDSREPLNLIVSRHDGICPKAARIHNPKA